MPLLLLLFFVRVYNCFKQKKICYQYIKTPKEISSKGFECHLLFEPQGAGVHGPGKMLSVVVYPSCAIRESAMFGVFKLGSSGQRASRQSVESLQKEYRLCTGCVAAHSLAVGVQKAAAYWQ